MHAQIGGDNMLKKNKRSLEEVLKKVAKDNGFVYVEPKNRANVNLYYESDPNDLNNNLVRLENKSESSSELYRNTIISSNYNTHKSDSIKLEAVKVEGKNLIIVKGSKRGKKKIRVRRSQKAQLENELKAAKLEELSTLLDEKGITVDEVKAIVENQPEKDEEQD